MPRNKTKYFTEEFFENYNDVFLFKEVPMSFVEYMSRFNPELNNLATDINNPECPYKYSLTVKDTGEMHSFNGSLKESGKIADKENLLVKNYNAKFKTFAEGLLNNPETADYRDFIKANLKKADDSWNYMKYKSFSPIPNAITNPFLGAPKFYKNNYNEIKNQLQEKGVLEPFNGVFSAINDILETDKRKFTSQNWTEEDEILHTQEIKEAYNKYIDNYYKLYNLNQSIQDESELMDNTLGHFTGRDVINGERSCMNDVGAMEYAVKAIDKGYNTDELDAFMFLGRASANLGFQKNKAVMQNEEDRIKVETMTNQGLKPLSGDELKRFLAIKEKKDYNQPTTNEEDTYFSQRNDRYLLNDFARLKEERTKTMMDFAVRQNDFNTKAEEFFNQKKPETFDEKIKFYNKVFEFAAKNKDYYKTEDAISKHAKLIDLRVDKLINDEAKKRFDNPDTTQKDIDELVCMKIENAIKYRNPDLYYNKKAEISKMAADYTKNLAITDYETFASADFNKKLESISDAVEDHNDYEYTKNRVESNLRRSHNDEGLWTAFQRVSEGIEIGSFGKQEYKDCKAMLENLCNTRYAEGRQEPDKIDNIEKNDVVYNDKFIKQEEKILALMDKYIARKEKEIKAAGTGYNRNSKARMDKMKEAREALETQIKQDKEIVAGRSDYVTFKLKAAEEKHKQFNESVEQEIKNRVNDKYKKASEINPEFAKIDELIAESETARKDLIKEGQKNTVINLNKASNNAFGDPNDPESYENIHGMIMEPALTDIYNDTLKETSEKMFDHVCKAMYLQLIKDKFAVKISAGNKMEKELKGALEPGKIEENVKNIKGKFDHYFKQTMHRELQEMVRLKDEISQKDVIELRDKCLKSTFNKYYDDYKYDRNDNQKTNMVKDYANIAKTDKLSDLLESPVTSKSLKIKEMRFGEKAQKLVNDEINNGHYDDIDNQFNLKKETKIVKKK